MPRQGMSYPPGSGIPVTGSAGQGLDFFSIIAGGIPVNTALPTISGTVQIGQVLTAGQGSWTNSPTSYAHQWQREGSAIGGAAGTTYTPVAADLGCLITVQEIATNGSKASLPAISALAGPTISTTVRYVSMTDGLDTNDGTSSTPGAPHGPWQTLSKVNGAALAAGTSVLFKRGDTWRDGSNTTVSGLKVARLNCQSGTSGNPIHYDAYGSGANPRFLGSVAANSTGHWTNTSGNIWRSNFVFQPPGGVNGQPCENASDIGNMTWGPYPNRSTTPMVDLAITRSGGPGGPPLSTATNESYLTTQATQGLWYFDPLDWKVHIYSTTNPATAMSPNLELGMDVDTIFANYQSYVTIQNFTVYNTAGHGVSYGGSGPITWITIRDNIVGWIGGGNLCGGTDRYGNGTQISGGGTFCMVERNWIFECYDGGITQETFTNPNTTFDNLTYRNNVVYNCPTLVELNLGDAGVVGDVESNIFFYNNTCPNPAGALGNANNRPPTNGNNHTLIGLTGIEPTIAFKLMNNSFTFGSEGLYFGNSALGYPDFPPGTPPSAFWGNALGTGFVCDYNNWVMASFAHSAKSGQANPDSATITQWAAGFTNPKEVHGLLQVAPQYVNSALGETDPNNLAPAVGSPLFNAGANLFSQGLVWDFNKKPRPSSGPMTIGAFQ